MPKDQCNSYEETTAKEVLENSLVNKIVELAFQKSIELPDNWDDLEIGLICDQTL